jgi:hypothetical protein
MFAIQDDSKSYGQTLRGGCIIWSKNSNKTIVRFSGISELRRFELRLDMFEYAGMVQPS